MVESACYSVSSEVGSGVISALSVARGRRIHKHIKGMRQNIPILFVLVSYF